MSIQPVSDSAFVSALGHAHDIALTAFTLPKGPVLDALVGAARDGAKVEVNLADDHFVHTIDEINQANKRATRELRAAGATVHLNNEKNSPKHPLHAKVAVVDGVGYLDERNWPSDGADVILRDDTPSDLDVMTAAIEGKATSARGLTMLKSEALEREAAQIASAGGTSIDVETESFGPGPVADALQTRAEAGDHVRLIVVKNDVYGANAHKQAKAAIGDLLEAGAEVHVNPTLGGVKLAVFEDDHAWVGSANATKGRPGTIDWGMSVRSPQVAAKLHDAFDTMWDRSKPYSAPAAGRASIVA